MKKRLSDHPIEPIFLDRWSPRAYTSEAIPDSDLFTILEAGRWAPSAYNIQPWRFLFSHRNDTHWQTYLGLLDSFNAIWARCASALVVVLSDSLMPEDSPQPNGLSRNHSFDAGAAWAQLALQATSLGYQAHAIAGIDLDRSRRDLAVPDRYRIEVAVAIGKRAAPSTLPPALQARETPSQRRTLTEIAFQGPFPE